MWGKIPSSTPIEEHDGELEALGRVQRHQDDLVLDLAIGEFVGVGDQRDLLEELVDHRELAGRADELAEVLDAAVRLDRVLRLELGEVAGVVERRLQHVGRTLRLVGGEPAEPIDQLDERRDAAHAPVR